MTLPIPKVAFDDRLAFVGVTGSGKSYGAGVCVEQLLIVRARCVIVDPLGVWWGLRLKPNGKDASPFDIPIFGGDHGDLALTEYAGQLIGETVAGMQESCILDLSGIGTKAGERRFMLAFLTALYRGVHAPVHLILDEADMFAPQRLLDKEGEAAKLLGMMETIVRRGRIKGFVPWLITQRPAVLSKDVLSQSDGIISFKLTASQDRDAIGAWIEGQADRQEGKTILASLPTRQRGEAVVWIPGRGILKTERFPEKITFDSSRTPKRGEKVKATALKPLDLSKLKERLATVEIEVKANDPKALKIEIAKLKRELAVKSAQPDPMSVQESYGKGYGRGKIEGYADAMLTVSSKMSGLVSIVNSFANVMNDLRSTAMQIEAWAAQTKPPKVSTVPPLTEGYVVKGGRNQGPSQITTRPAPPAPITTSPSPTVRNILNEIHRVYPIALSFEAASLRAGVSRRSSAYRQYRREVEASEEIERRHDGKLQSAPGFADPVHAGADPVETFAARLPPSYAAMLRAIAAAKQPMTREEIAAAAEVSPTSSGLIAGLRELQALGLVERDGQSYALSRGLAA